MYPQILRNFAICSSKLRSRTNLKNTSLIFSALSTQKLLPYINNQGFVKFFSSKLTLDDLIKLPRDPEERNRKLEHDAQKKLDEMRKTNPETDKLIKILELEITVMKQDGQRVPEKIRASQWLEILKSPNRSQRRKYLDYLFVIEKQKEARKQEKYEKNLEYERWKNEEKPDEEEKGIIYGVGHNSFFRRINETTMNNLYNWNCMKSIMFGNKIIYDFSYESYMNQKEVKSCAKQIREAFAQNRIHDYPFDIYFCNVNMSGELIKHLFIMIPSLMDDDFPITITSKSYLELFDKSQLVYLTANAPSEVKKYNPDSIYIIGALVDKGPSQPLSLAKAKEEGIAMAKLPLDRYLRFGFGSSKNLAINQVLAIMQDAQNSDWETALKHVPTRKLMQSRIASMERKIQRDTFKLQNNTELNDEEEFDTQYLAKKIRSYESKPVNDYSNAARAKLRDRWNK